MMKLIIIDIVASFCAGNEKNHMFACGSVSQLMYGKFLAKPQNRMLACRFVSQLIYEKCCQKHKIASFYVDLLNTEIT